MALLKIAAVLLPVMLLSCSAAEDEKVRRPGEIETRSVIRMLSSDLMEGRAPGTRGGELAEEYCRSVLEILGIGPWNGEYMHRFELVGFTTPELSIEAEGVGMRLGDDIMGSLTAEGPFSMTAGAVFVGYGIESEAWSWDDYKDVPVEGKIVVCRVNEPGRDDPDLFEGDALTYYGRWTYKIEEAASRGAAGILMVHTDETAGYGWHVVRNSWGGEELYLPSMLEGDMVFRGWVREETIAKALERAGHSLAGLYDASERRDFRPVDLGVDLSVSGGSVARTLKTSNVVGFIEGNAPGLKDRSIVLSAHIDHLGIDPDLPGHDRIYNGAIDNGSAVAAMMMTARLIEERREELDCSLIVLACQAEEAGLLGSRHFAENVDPGSIVCNINFESTPVWERSGSILGVGAEHSTFDELIPRVAADMGLEYSMFSMADRGFFYRSDQFSFARVGIPAVWISAGEDFESGVNHALKFFTGAYHTVEDEYDPSWELASTAQTIEAAVRLVMMIDGEKPDMRWKGRMTFPVSGGPAEPHSEESGQEDRAGH